MAVRVLVDEDLGLRLGKAIGVLLALWGVTAKLDAVRARRGRGVDGGDGVGVEQGV